MKKYLHYIFWTILYIVSPVRLCSAVFMPISTGKVADTLQIIQVPYVYEGQGGNSCVWDFSALKDSLIHRMDYYKCSEYVDTWGLHRLGMRYYYTRLHDTILATAYESEAVRMHYTTPETVLTFPFKYGDTLNSRFAAKGEFFHAIPVHMHGQSTVTIDAQGTLILPNLQLDSVLRIHTRRTLYETRFDSTYITMHCFQWVLPSFPFPLFETLDISSESQSDTTNHKYAFYLLVDSTMLQHHIARSTTHNGDTLMNPSIISQASFLPNPVQDILQISYFLSRDAEVWFSLHNNSGVPIIATPVDFLQSGHHHYSINMSHCPTGVYVLYIHADNIVVAQSIIKE